MKKTWRQEISAEKSIGRGPGAMAKSSAGAESYRTSTELSEERMKNRAE
jgi:hypothetical protein